MSAITTHVLDTSRGCPARGVPVELEIRIEDDTWRRIGRGATDGDGRLRTLMPEGEPLVGGVYRLLFDVHHYFAETGTHCFYPRVTVEFSVAGEGSHYHVPLLISPFGYTTYRGS